jgi:hypothetical protein
VQRDWRVRNYFEEIEGLVLLLLLVLLVLLLRAWSSARE